MDIGNIKMVKDTIIKIKETTKKESKPLENKQGCIKMIDYMSF